MANKRFHMDHLWCRPIFVRLSSGLKALKDWKLKVAGLQIMWAFITNQFYSNDRPLCNCNSLFSISHILDTVSRIPVTLNKFLNKFWIFEVTLIVKFSIVNNCKNFVIFSCRNSSFFSHKKWIKHRVNLNRDGNNFGTLLRKRTPVNGPWPFVTLVDLKLIVY